jgi:hypothetical protein
MTLTTRHAVVYRNSGSRYTIHSDAEPPAFAAIAILVPSGPPVSHLLLVRALRSLLIRFLLIACLASVAQARLGETEAQMVARFGKPTLRTTHTVHSQGKSWDLGPSFHFRQDDWTIQCDLIDARCVRVVYGKRGEWTDEQLEMVLAYNSQGLKWERLPKPGFEKNLRSWKRSDGATADWNWVNGMKLTVPAYDRAKQTLEAKAKAGVSGKPKI